MTGSPENQKSLPRRSFEPWNDRAAQPLIRFDNVSKTFGTVTAIDRVSLDIYEGEFFGLLGPSGCGKTTLMRMLAGFERPTRGRVWLGGEDLTDVPPYRRPVNMMFQSYALFPHMTVAQNIAFGLKQGRMPRAEIDARVEQMLALVNLEGLGARKPDQLSGGQRQRVALARALAKRPRVLLLDEPMAALDKKLREETQFELMELQRTLKTTFIIVTHDQEEAMTVADRIAVMDHGKLAQVAVPEEIYEKPDSRFVANFVGDVNLIEATVLSRDVANVRLESADLTTPLVIAPPQEAQTGAKVVIALRPEKISISKEPVRDGEANSARGVVFDIAYLGDLSIYHVRLASGFVMKAASPNLRRRTEGEITWDDEVTLCWTSDAGVLLLR